MTTPDYRAMLEIALEEARTGLAEGGIPIGAALFHRDGTLLGRGRNRRVQENDPSVHGETDAFRKAGNQELLDRMAARHPSIFYGAPLLVVISMSQDNLSGVDAGIAIENLAIAAQSMGLGSCIIGMAAAGFNGDEGDELARLIEMPADHAFVISIAIGYPAMSKKAHARNRDKIKIVD